MPGEVLAIECHTCGGMIECSWRSKLRSEYYCVNCGRIYPSEPKKIISDDEVGRIFKEVTNELISHGIVKPEMKIVSRIVMKRLKLGTMSYVVGDTVERVFPR